MASNNYQQVPFWDFIRSFNQQHGAGVDHPAPDFPFFGPPPPPPGAHPPPPPHHHHGPGFSHPPPPPFGGFDHWGSGPFGGFGGGGFGGPGGRGRFGGRGGHCGRGRHGHRHEREGGAGDEANRSRDNSPHTVENSGDESPENENAPRGPHGRRRHGNRGERSENEAGEGHHRRGPRSFGHRGWGRHSRGWGHHAHRGPPGPPPPFPFPFGRPTGPPGAPGSFDMSALIEALSAHPLAQTFRQYAEQAGFAPAAQRSAETLVPEDVDAEDTFVPPIDIFSTEKEYVLHVSLPGAKKDDVGVNWDEDKGLLNVAGVVYRRGDEEFLQTLAQSERKVGMFERSVRLPPNEDEKDEVDGDGISAKLEDGVLIVTVPKIEKEWTEVNVKKVEIE